MSDNTERGSVHDISAVTMEAAAERRLVRPGESARHIDLSITAPLAAPGAERPPLSLALVVDRSGSMHGNKLTTAKAAALAVLDRLEARDRAAVVIFDSSVETILSEGPMTMERKAEARTCLAKVEAGSSTALHEGWLTGCRAIAADTSVSTTGDRLSRCFLLTDGLANQGLTDPEAVAAQAAEVRANAGVGTSTFGVGEDYDEGLLAPMAVAGSGQFHNLRNLSEITEAFAGELGELFNVTARSVRIELEHDTRVTPEMVSMYQGAQGKKPGTLTVDIGDLIAAESRHIVVRLHFSGLDPGETASVRARVSWRQGEDRHAGEWRELRFECAAHPACDAEARSMAVMHWVGIHHADKAKKEAIGLYHRDDFRGAVAVLTSVIHRLREYAKGDADLEKALEELERQRQVCKEGKLTRAMSKELTHGYMSSSRGQRDHRGKHS